MVQSAHAVLRNALSNAVREELVNRNAAKLVKMSNPEYDVGAGLDPITARTFLAEIADDRLFALYLCAIVLGLCRGELLGVTWDAVDLDGGRLAVRQALSWVDGRAVIQPPKTRASRSVIPLPDVVIAARREHQERQDAERADAAERWEDTGFVFTTRQGRPMAPYTLVKYWHDVLERPAWARSDLAIFAIQPSRCFGARRPAARRPGDRRPQRHSDTKVTMMVYAHGNLSEKAAALAQLGEAVSGGLMSPVDVRTAAAPKQDRPTTP